MTALPPSESDPQPVVAWPGWVWWLDEYGWRHARRDGLAQVDAGAFTALLDAIRKAEGGRSGQASG